MKKVIIAMLLTVALSLALAAPALADQGGTPNLPNAEWGLDMRDLATIGGPGVVGDEASAPAGEPRAYGPNGVPGYEHGPNPQGQP